jgi:succinoglycan biosynthesis protein ExoM
VSDSPSPYAEPTAQLQIAICVCTYRRPELQATLESLGSLKLPPDCRVRVVVADNDVTPTAQELVLKFARDAPFPIDYVHSPARNISIARNACLDAARGDFAAFIDDDETASPDWLIRLLETAKGTRADVVLGPVQASYRPDAPGWMIAGDFHSTMPVWVKGEIKTGYTCNVLLDLASPHVVGRRFDLALGRSGGEDTLYFAHLHMAGGRIAFAHAAWVYESVPPSRAQLIWLLKRRFRVGQTHGRLLAQGRSSYSKIPQFFLAASKVIFSFGTAVVYSLWPELRYRAFLRGIMHAGAMSGLFGIREIEQYGVQSTLHPQKKVHREA